jgi:hypothetical protein
MNLDDINPIAEITKAVRLHRQLAEQAKADLKTALPVLTEILSHQSGKSAKVAAILQSVWNGELCDNLASLDTKVAKAVIATIAVYAQLSSETEAEFQAAMPVIKETLGHRSGQSYKVAAILTSLSEGKLGDALAPLHLDPEVARGVVAMIGARAFLSGDADSLLRPLLNRKEGHQS